MKTVMLMLIIPFQVLFYGVGHSAPFIIPNDQILEEPPKHDPERCEEEHGPTVQEETVYPMSPSGIVLTITPLECGIERPTPVEDLVANYYMANGLEAFMYDTNHDGDFDAQIMIPQGDINRYPVIYMFDRDYDGDPDIKYTDQMRDGSCGKITWEKLEMNKGNSKLKES